MSISLGVFRPDVWVQLGFRKVFAKSLDVLVYKGLKLRMNLKLLTYIKTMRQCRVWILNYSLILKLWDNVGFPTMILIGES